MKGFRRLTIPFGIAGLMALGVFAGTPSFADVYKCEAQTVKNLQMTTVYCQSTQGCASAGCYLNACAMCCDTNTLAKGECNATGYSHCYCNPSG